jgi:hypothetical protein
MADSPPKALRPRVSFLLRYAHTLLHAQVKEAEA